MPTYEYECPEHGEFEEFHSITTKLEYCPKCEDSGKKQEVKRLISGGSGKGVMSLTDEEFKANLKGEVSKMKKRAVQNENYMGNLIGEDRAHKKLLSR
jgi:putative FmdB family regulatory protein